MGGGRRGARLRNRHHLSRSARCGFAINKGFLFGELLSGAKACRQLFRYEGGAFANFFPVWIKKNSDKKFGIVRVPFTHISRFLRSGDL